MRKSKGLRDVSASTGFLKALARNGNVSVNFIQDLKVPCAFPDGRIHLSIPTIDTLDEWEYLCHHEVSHCFPANRYHFPTMPIAHGINAGLIMNIMLDNLAERYEFERYEGRREILSRGNLDMVNKLGAKMFKEPENVHEELTLGLIAWDCEQRTSWMGYPFNTYESPVGQYREVCDYLDEIELERLLDEQKTTDDLIAILHKVLAYTEREKEKDDDEQEQDNGSDSGSGGDGQSPEDEDREGGETDDKAEDGEGGDDGGSEPDPEPTRSEDDGEGSESAGGGEGEPGSAEETGGDDSQGPGESSNEDPSDQPGEGAVGPEADGNPEDGSDAEGSGSEGESGDGSDGNQPGTGNEGDPDSKPETTKVPDGQGDGTPGRGSESEDGDSESGEGNPGAGRETGEPNKEHSQDENGGDEEGHGDHAPEKHDHQSQGGYTLRPTEPYDGNNVAPETKELVEELLMIVEDNKVPSGEGPYQPTTDIKWIPLKRNASRYDESTINRLIGTSKVSKSIQKYLQAVSQTSYQYGTKTGRLSSRSIYKTGGGGANIFKKRVASRIEKNTAVTLLADCSGSMENGYGVAKYQTAFSCIAIMSETLTSLRIPHEILGFTEQEIMGDSQVQMIEFKSFQEMLKRPAMVDRLSRCPEMWNNHDAESILEAASRLSTRKEKNKLLIVLSDGNPVGHFYPGDWEASEYLKQVCSHIEEDTDIDLFGIGIESHTVKHYYRDYEVVQRASEMDTALMTLLKKKILK